MKNMVMETITHMLPHNSFIANHFAIFIRVFDFLLTSILFFLNTREIPPRPNLESMQCGRVKFMGVYQIMLALEVVETF